MCYSSNIQLVLAEVSNHLRQRDKWLAILSKNITILLFGDSKVYKSTTGFISARDQAWHTIDVSRSITVIRFSFQSM